MAAMVMTAKVSAVDYAKGHVKVILTDRDDMVSDWIPMLSHEYEMPDIGDIVTCDFAAEDCKTGFCRGRYHNDKCPPTKSGKDIYNKKLLKDADIEYNRAKKELTITVENIKVISKRVRIRAKTEFDGDMHIEGNLRIKGNLVVDGTIHANNVIESCVPMQAPNYSVAPVPKIEVEEVVIE